MPVFPPFGGGGGGGDIAPLEVFYVSPTGSDSNTGKSWAESFLTIDRLLQAYDDNQGCIAYVSGPVGGVGGGPAKLWFRSDGLSLPDWHGDHPLVIFGIGTDTTQFGWPFAPVTMGAGYNGGRFTPGIWLSGTQQPKVFNGIGPASNFCNQFVRSWDYRRTLAGDIEQLPITSWVRTATPYNSGGITGTLSTVSLGLGSPVNITSASRVGALVTIHFSYPRQPMGTALKGGWIRVSSTDPNFDSGDFEITGGDGAFFGNLQYNQVTSTGSASGTNIGTFQTNGVNPLDRIDVVSTQPNNLPSTQYKVLSVTNATDVVVIDVYGGQTIAYDGTNPTGTWPATGTFSTPGTYAFQDRAAFGCSMFSFQNMQAYVSGTQLYDRPEAGPLVDFGGTADGRTYMLNVAPKGYQPQNGCLDPDRQCWLLGDGGSFASPQFQVFDGNPALGGIRYWGPQGGWGSVWAGNLIGDTPINQATQPAFQAINGGNAEFALNRLRVADNSGGSYDVIIDACLPNSVVQGCGLVSGPVQIMGNAGTTGDSGWKLHQVGFWADGRVSGNFADTRRNSGVQVCRYSNLIVAPVSWQLNGNTLTTGVNDPFGGTGAVRLTGSGNTFPYPQDTGTALSVGDTWVLGTWIRHNGGWSGYLGGYLMHLSVINNLAAEVVGCTLTAGFPGDGEWQFVYSSVTVSSTSGASWFVRCNFTNPGVSGIEYYQPFLFRIPASDGLTPDEVAEYVGTISTQSRYLTPGMTGTQELIKLIGHGGLGSSKHYVSGVSSGQITVGSANGKYMELFDETGASLGVVPFSSFTVNP